MGLGIVHMHKCDYVAAGQWIEKAIHANPDNPALYVHMGNNLLLQNKSEEAKSNYQIAISIHPKLFEAHFRIAGLLMSEKQLEDAEYHFEYASYLQPENADCHANLGQTYELLHRIETAHDSAMKALQLKHDHIGALMLLG